MLKIYCNFAVQIIDNKTKNHMTKAELVTAIAVQTGYDRATIANVLEAAMYNVKQTLAADEGVFLRGFGSLVVKVRAEKVARNIHRNTTIIVPEHRIPQFKPSPEFTDMMNPEKKK